jgi:Branched-chain amino acid transport protein (AzlD)
MSIFGIDGALAPYLILIFFGFLPSEIWRFMSVFVARRIDENSQIFVYVRTVAAVLLVGIVGKLIFTPSGVLALVPLAARLGAVGVGAAAFLIFRRSVLAAVFAGEAAIIAAGYYFVR